ncbi:tetratricopeptide repeat protein [Streptomyces sp. NPDC058319]|uniref:tetratricopeptide repeat protein n=1 Tax=unclassified Streptomyces TaxID=2593676 RepID=UPI0036EBE946
MYRLSREKKREQKRAARSATSAAAPIAVHVPVPTAGSGDGDGGGGGARAWASVAGVRLDPAPGEEIQQTVLNHLHRIALTTGRPVLATVTDERIGYVVPLRVHGDGSSTFTAQPLRTAPPPLEPAPETGHRELGQQGEQRERYETDRPLPDEGPTHVLRRLPRPSGEPRPASGPRSGPRWAAEAQGAQKAREAQGAQGASEPSPTFVLRPARDLPDGDRPDPTRTADPAAGPTADLTAGPTADPVVDPTAGPTTYPAPDAAPDAAPAPVLPPGTAMAPTGSFGPPPVMDPERPASAGTRPAVVPGPAPELAEPAPLPVSVPRPAVAPVIDPETVIGLDPDPRPTPARGFDAVAEAVLGDDPRTLAGGGGAVLLAEPLAQVNEAVRAGQIEEAAALAERTVAEASGTLGATHPEVLRVRELSAYIAYLAGESERAFALSLDLARIHRAADDAEGAYGNVRSAATAWRGVRDPEEGLRLGGELLGLWTELAAEDGPAAEDIEELESASIRMERLTERAGRRSGGR